MIEEEKKKFLINLIDRLTPLNNKWRSSNIAIKKIEIMWSMGYEVDNAIKNSNFGFDELLRTLYDPHGKKMTYITRDLLSYSHRVYLYFKSYEMIEEQLCGLKSYTLFREAFPLITNNKYNQEIIQKQEIISLITNPPSIRIAQSKLKKIKQSIRPIKNTRTSKSNQNDALAKWLNELRDKVTNYYRDNDVLVQDCFPISQIKAQELKKILLAIAFDKNLNEEFNINTLKDEMAKQLAKIANSKTEDKARFKKWCLDTYSLMTFAEMLNASLDSDKYNFVRQKVISTK